MKCNVSFGELSPLWMVKWDNQHESHDQDMKDQ